jgi:hypothetical protein
MTWILILITILPFKTTVHDRGNYSSMERCFMARETTLVDMGQLDGYPPINQNLICIRTDQRRG